MTLKVFTQTFECDYCKGHRELVEEVAAQSPNVSVEVYDFVEDSKVAASYAIDKVPAVPRSSGRRIMAFACMASRPAMSSAR